MDSNIVITVIIVLGLYMAWNIGANDVANAMGTSVGSKAITFKKAILIAAIFELVGAIFVGGSVTETIAKDIVSPELTANIDVFVLGMISALFGASVWLNVATRLGLPVSTTHSIVGAVMGFGAITSGIGSINWNKVIQIVLSWIVSPLAGALISFLLFAFLLRRVIATKNSVEEIKKVAPYLVFLVAFTLTLSMVYKGLANLHLDLPIGMALLWALVIGLCAAALAKRWVDKIRCSANASFAHKMRHTERVFAVLQIITACYVAFAHGSNDVANAVGPVAAVVEAVKSGHLNDTVIVQPWILVMGGVGIVIGLATFGKYVIKTIGENIMHLQPSRGFAAEFGCASTVLICSKLGLPVSTTHTIVGAIVGVGLARGIGAINMKSVKSIVTSWLWTIPFSAALTILVYIIARVLFL